MSLTNDTATYSEETFKCSDGIKIEYRDYESTSYLHRVPIICLHGLTRNLKDFEDVAPKIAALGFRTIVPSQRGRGRSDYDKTSANYNPEQYTSDMIELLDQLDISKAIFVGSSMGGIITMLLSMRQPNRVRAAILNDIGTELDPAGVSRIMGYVGKLKVFKTWQDAAAGCRNGNGHAFPKETSDKYWMKFARRVCRQTVLGEVTYDYDLAIAAPTRSAHAKIPDYTEAFATLKQKPVLLVRGQSSDLLSVETVKKMRQIHPALDYCEVENVGHVPFLSEPCAWARVEEFLLTTK